MRSSNKSRSRSKSSNRNRNVGNVVNRVFDSAGPEGKVRGTPSQIIEKYVALARDAQLSGDRVAAENFQQHAEHYLRMLSEAQREQAERQAQEARHRPQHQGGHDGGGSDGGHQQSRGGQDNSSYLQDPGFGDQPDVVLDSHDDDGPDLVETPETSRAEAPKHDTPKPERKPRTRSRRSAQKDSEAVSAEAQAE